MTALQRPLGALSLWSMAVGIVIAGQYFGWNLGSAINLSSFFIALAIVSLFYYCFIHCYSQLAIAMPQSSGAATFARQALYKPIAKIVALACFMELFFALIVVDIASASYLHFLYPTLSIQNDAIMLLACFTVLNLAPITFIAQIETVATIAALLGLIAFYYFGFKIPALHQNITLFTQPKLYGIAKAIPYAIWIFLAIEAGALSVEEMKNPQKDLAKGLLFAIITTIFLSFLTVYCSYRLLYPDYITVHFPLAKALSLYYGHDSAMVWFCSIAALLGLLASLNGLLFALSRQVYAYAHIDLAPSVFRTCSKKQVPYPSVLCCAILALIGVFHIAFANFYVQMAALGAFVMYIATLLCWLILYQHHKLAKQRTKIPPQLVPILALVSGALCLYGYFIIQLNRVFSWKGHWLALFLLLLISLTAFYLLYLYRHKILIAKGNTLTHNHVSTTPD